MTMIKDRKQGEVVELISDYRIVAGDDNTIVASRGSGKVDVKHVKEVLESAGYSHARRAIKQKNGEVEVTLLLDQDAWKQSVPDIFLSLRDLWENYRFRSDAPEAFIVPDDLREEAEKFMEAFCTYLKVKRLLEKVSDHTTETGSALLFHNKKDSIRKDEISLNVDYETLKDLDVSPEKDKAVDSLLQCVSLEEDAHSHERENVLKNVIVEELEKQSFTQFFPLLYHSSRSLLDRYKEQYKVYVDRFSVNKILNDISEKNLEYSSKVNEFVSSGQAKAFTIPGAIIAVGALVRTGINPLSLFVIVFGLYMIKELVMSANQIYRESFDHLSKQVSYTFDRFHELDDSTEVHKHANDSKREVSERIRKAKERLDHIDCFSKVMVWVGVAFLLITLIMSWVA
ncbi:hypothetical protein [Halomonas sp. H5]|uniref:hypothetical protein n=1 Tax=Halomonas sp. H5 TaxID=3423910 RepID=UPI003D36FD88